MAFMLCRNGGGCQRFNPESQVFAHVGGRPRVKEKPPAPPRDRQPLLRERARAQKPDFASAFSLSSGAISKPCFSSAATILRSEEHTSELQSPMRNSYAV